MGKSGYLPNVSQSFGLYKTLAIRSVQRKDYNAAASALYSLNGCLGDDYLVTISTEIYNQTMANQIVWQCNECTMKIKKTVYKGTENEKVKEIEVPTEVPVANVSVFEITHGLVQQLITKNPTKQMWCCPSCKIDQDTSETKQIVPQRVAPFCIGVVTDCPIRRQNSCIDRGSFDAKFEKWFWNFLEEINWKEVQYRKEYKNQNDGQDMDMSFDDKGDDS